MGETQAGWSVCASPAIQATASSKQVPSSRVSCPPWARWMRSLTVHLAALLAGRIQRREHLDQVAPRLLLLLGGLVLPLAEGVDDGDALSLGELGGRGDVAAGDHGANPSGLLLLLRAERELLGEDRPDGGELAVGHRLARGAGGRRRRRLAGLLE